MAIMVLPSSSNFTKEVIVDCTCDWKLIAKKNPNLCKRCGGFINYKVGI